MANLPQNPTYGDYAGESSFSSPAIANAYKNIAANIRPPAGGSVLATTGTPE